MCHHKWHASTHMPLYFRTFALWMEIWFEQHKTKRKYFSHNLSVNAAKCVCMSYQSWRLHGLFTSQMWLLKLFLSLFFVTAAVKSEFHNQLLLFGYVNGLSHSDLQALYEKQGCHFISLFLKAWRPFICARRYLEVTAEFNLSKISNSATSSTRRPFLKGDKCAQRV